MAGFEIRMPLGARTIINTLWSKGFEAYLVGGCVRDSFRDVYPKDWDICTNARPEKVKRCLEDYRIFDTGIKHGTVTVVVYGEPYEVTTYRVDGKYTDHRHPDSVSFTASLEEDLARRDFTINAMAYSELTGLIDPFGGLEDVNSRFIRCVGDADKRFEEDPLRILRAMRFSSVLGFIIEEETSLAMSRNKKKLDYVSKERIRDELCKMLMGEHALEVLYHFFDIVFHILPEMRPCYGFAQNNPYHTYTIYGHILHAVDAYKGNDLTVRLALLLHDIGKPNCYTEDEKGGHFKGHAPVSRDIAEQILDRLKFDNQTKHDVLELVLFHDAEIKATPRVVRKWLNRIGEKQFNRLLDVRRADIKAHAPGTQYDRLDECVKVKLLTEDIIEQRQCFSLKDLKINGDDIINMGVLEGKEVGDILKYLLDEVIEGNIPNKHHMLMLAADQEICRRSMRMEEK